MTGDTARLRQLVELLVEVTRRLENLVELVEEQEQEQEQHRPALRIVGRMYGA